MAHPIKFDGANACLGAPRGTDPDAPQVQPMHVFRNGVYCVSCWELDPEELEEVKRTGRVWVSVMSGATQPPIYAGGMMQTRDLISDYGVWPVTVDPAPALQHEFRIWQDDEVVAAASAGSREEAWSMAHAYACQYAQDGDIAIEEAWSRFLSDEEVNTLVKAQIGGVEDDG